MLQYLYPTTDIALSRIPFGDDADDYMFSRGFYNVKTRFLSTLDGNSLARVIKSTTSTSGYYTYIDEGIPANDADYISMSGRLHMVYLEGLSPVQYAYTYLTFGTYDLQVVPSSITVNLRSRYRPLASVSGIVDTMVMVHTSGFASEYVNLSEGYGQGLVFRGVNDQCVLASSFFSVTSGDFQTYTATIPVNEVARQSIDRYSRVYLTLGIRQNDTYSIDNSQDYTLFDIAAVEAIVSGDVSYSTKGNNLHIIGGSGRNLRSDRLQFYHDYQLNDINSNNPGRDELTYPQVFFQNQDSPNLCLNRSTNRQDIFRDCFFKLDRSGVAYNVSTERNVLTYDSNTSNHLLFFDNILGSTPVPHVGAATIKTPALSRVDNSIIFDDSHLTLDYFIYGSVDNFLPSGDFSVWLGIDNLPVAANLTSQFPLLYTLSPDASYDFRFGKQGNLIYTQLNGGPSITAFPSRGQFNGFIITYASSILSMYEMSTDGKINLLASTTPFSRITQTQPSSLMTINYLSTLGLAYTATGINPGCIYELGVVNSGISSTDISALDRRDIFRNIDVNLDVQPVTSGTPYVPYESLQSRVNAGLPSVSNYSSVPYYYGYSIPAILPIGDFVASAHPAFYDYDVATANLWYRYTQESGTVYDYYNDITVKCNVSGNNVNFYQDGDIYFSGWLDASTTNPSGFRENNAVVRVWKDASLAYNGIFDVYNQFSGTNIIYDSLIQARGKVAAAVFTLRSGLNEYIIPLEMENYYFDIYQDITPPSVGGWSPYGPAIKYYDKRTVAHLDWDGADASVMFLGHRDPESSGYIDRIQFHTIGMISDYWSTPPTGISAGIPLYTEGHATLYSGCDLFLAQNNEAKGCDLFCFCENIVPFSGSPVTLITIAGSSAFYRDCTLYTQGPYPTTSGIPLYISGPIPYTSGIPLYLPSDPPASLSGNVPLYTYSTLDSGITNSIPLYIEAANHSRAITLFTKVNETAEYDRNITLFLKGEGEMGTSIPFYLHNEYSSIGSRLRLSITGDGLTDGASVYRRATTLYIGSGTGEVAEGGVPLHLEGPSGTINSTTLFVEGGTYVYGGVDLSLIVGVGPFSGAVRLFSHGF